MDEEKPKRRPSISQLSKTPSWLMLGFILGALAVWSLPRREPPQRPIIIAPAPAETPRRTEPPQLTTIEAVFGEWDEFAVWHEDTTQVAMWNSGIGDFVDLYEVLRVSGIYYFRSIPQLTRRVIRHGKQPPPECPLRFTETEEQYREWREHGRFERPPEQVRPSLSVPRELPARPTPSGTVAPVRPPPIEPQTPWKDTQPVR